jgi:hypothetical protein
LCITRANRTRNPSDNGLTPEQKEKDAEREKQEKKGKKEQTVKKQEKKRT